MSRKPYDPFEARKVNDINTWGRKRCRSVSSALNFRCTKARAHLADLDVVHQNRFVIWRDDEPKMPAQPSVFKLQPSHFKVPKGWLEDALAGLKDTSIRLEGTFDSAVDTDFTKSRLGQWMSSATHNETFDETHHFDTAIMHSMCADSCGPKCTTTSTVSDEELELRRWWMGLAESEIDRTVPKAVEYSSTDLTDIGHDLARTQGREIDDEEAAELGVFFYLRGKVARWVGAMIAGQRVSDDTLFDIGVYVRMAQRIRATGSWPGIAEDDSVLTDDTYPGRSAG